MIHTFKAAINRYHIRYARFAAVYTLLAAAAAIGNIVSVRATGGMTQSALTAGEEMMGFLLIMAVSGCVRTAVEGISVFIRQRFYARTLHSMRSVFAKQLLFMPYQSVAAKNSGEGASLFANDVPQAATFVTTQILSQISQIATLAISVAFMAYINWWMTFAYFALFPPLAILQSKLSAPIGSKSIEASKRQAEFNAVVTDALQNPLTIKAYALEASVERRYEASYQQYYDATQSYVKTLAKLSLLGICATVTPSFALIIASSAAVISGGMSLPEFITLIILAEPVGSWLSMFAQDMARMRRASASVTRGLEYMPEATPKTTGALSTATSAPYAIAFENVTFGYNDEVKALDGISFTVEKGSLTAVTGASGSGKSTLLKLILGLYAPDSGKILLSSQSVSYVPQECTLLPVSIRENILCDQPADETKIRVSCENAGIYSFIAGLPEGFDTVLAESAANVSGGQKQRIAMARAFYRDADILLFDEATSALDPDTEKAILDTFQQYVKASGKTALAVAHRQSVIDLSDHVLKLGKGTAEYERT